MAKYDIFISYSTEDYAWVAQLTDELEKRGVRVWIDRNRIRPGDNFAEALERGLESSGAVGLVITPRSIASGWVREEYYRAIALSKTQNLRLIPLLVEDAELPGFLSGRQYVDFCSSDHLDFEDSVSRLIWPGITGKEILIILKDIEILGGIEYGWSHLRWILTEQKVRRNRHTEPDKFETRVTLAIKEGYRVVVIADIFDYWPWRDWRKYGYLTPNDHVQTLFSLRERTEIPRTRSYLSCIIIRMHFEDLPTI